MLQRERRTKIVCTLGPSSDSKEVIEQLIRNGMNVARLNFSHGSHEDHEKTIRHIRSVSEKLNLSVSILADLQGPKIRVGAMKEGAQDLEAGQYVTLTSKEIVGDSETIPIDYPNLGEDVREGNKILMDDGLLELKIVKKSSNDIVAQVVIGGILKSRKGVNLPDVNISMSSLTEKDIEDLEFAMTNDVDFVAMSFVRSASDVQEVISRLRAKGSQAGIVAKIEKPEAVEVIDEIIEEADGIMVARGDLGIEIASERVPLIQKKIIDRCRRAGKPVITATQMLESMVKNARATRAESSDVANAVLDGTDAVMLSGETAVGNYPVEALKTMDKICRSVESQVSHIYNSLGYVKPEWREKQIIESLAYSCISMSDNVEAKAIATITQSGNTARRIAKFRPKVTIVAFTESEKIRCQLALVWGVRPVIIDKIFDTDTDHTVRVMEKYLKNSGLVSKGDRVILATGMPIAKRGHTNMIKISSIE